MVEPLIVAFEDDELSDKILSDWAFDKTYLELERELVKIGKPAVRPLITALNSKHEKVCKLAVEVLGAIGKPAVVPLINALESEDAKVRKRAAESLGRIGDKQAVEPSINAAVKPLINALENEGKNFSFVIIVALGQITGQDFGEDLTKWREWWEKNKK